MRDSVFLCLGHALLDMRCYLNEFPRTDGMTLLLKPIQNSCGGSAANVAYNLSRMSLKARLCAAVGDGNVGKLIINTLDEEGIDISSIRRLKGDTGKAIVLIDKEGHVKVLESVGVCDKYFKPRIEDFKEVSHLHMTGTNLKLLYSYSKMADLLGITISFDPGRGKSKLGTKTLGPILKRTTILFLNRSELSLLTRTHCETLEQVKELAQSIATEFGCSIVVKGGSKEILAYHKDRFYLKKPRKVKVIDSIGAGDAFDSGFIASYKANGSISRSLEFAARIASLKVQRLGAQALPPRKIVSRLYRKLCRPTKI